ncbi:MFS transporter [Agrobacterium rubi]|uniref:MFS transporter n=1 Tax=Agrobacterium rubi TaxID=28099 RepID=UPI001F282102|nr:MFS transporter [Agrobacterium rubi]
MATAWSIVPIIGPSIGGVIDQAAGWRSIFICLTAVGIAVAAYSLPLIPSKKSTSLSLADYMRSYVNLLTSLKYLFSVCTMAFCLGALYVYLGQVTAVLRIDAISNNIVTGIVISAAPLGFFVGSFISGSLSKTRSRGFNMVSGRVLVLAGMILSLALAVPNVGGITPIALAGFFTGLGNGITLPNASSMAISVNKELTGAAVGLASAISLGFGGVIAFICGIFIQDHLTDSVLLTTLLAVAAASTVVTWIAVKAK